MATSVLQSRQAKRSHHRSVVVGHTPIFKIASAQSQGTALRAQVAGLSILFQERMCNKLQNWRRVATPYDKAKEPCPDFVRLVSFLQWIPFYLKAKSLPVGRQEKV